MWTLVFRTVAVLGIGLALAARLTAGLQSAETPRATALLDQYLRGDFEVVVRTLATFDTFDSFAEDLEASAPAWIAAAAPEMRERRELTAATLALEAARVGQWREWKQIQRLEVVTQQLTLLYFLVRWQPPARLLEWGCDLLRARAAVSAGERWWHLASIAVAERAQDGEFLVGRYSPPPLYITREIEHAVHLQRRLPDEWRIKLAIGIAEDLQNARDAARRTFTALLDHPDVGAEAAVRLGSAMLRQGAAEEAIALFDRAESRTRDPWVLYLARFFKGRASELRRRPAEAERAYRAALRAVPNAQSGVVGLATLLSKDGRRWEASTLTASMLASGAIDPWRAFADADDRFWPELIARVRAEIHP
jgi:tetratricopeptide (TPR) repeat protein